MFSSHPEHLKTPSSLPVFVFSASVLSRCWNRVWRLNRLFLKLYELSLSGMVPEVASTSPCHKVEAQKGQLLLQAPPTWRTQEPDFGCAGHHLATLADALTSSWKPRNMVPCCLQPLSKVPGRSTCPQRHGTMREAASGPGRDSEGQAEAAGTRASSHSSGTQGEEVLASQLGRIKTVFSAIHCL